MHNKWKDSEVNHHLQEYKYKDVTTERLQIKSNWSAQSSLRNIQVFKLKQWKQSGNVPEE